MGVEHIEKTQLVRVCLEKKSELNKLKSGNDAEREDSTGIKWIWSRNSRFNKLRNILGENIEQVHALKCLEQNNVSETFDSNISYLLVKMSFGTNY